MLFSEVPVGSSLCTGALPTLFFFSPHFPIPATPSVSFIRVESTCLNDPSCTCPHCLPQMCAAAGSSSVCLSTLELILAAEVYLAQSTSACIFQLLWSFRCEVAIIACFYAKGSEQEVGNHSFSSLCATSCLSPTHAKPWLLYAFAPSPLSCGCGLGPLTYDFIYLLKMVYLCLPECMCVHYIDGACGGQKRVSKPLELELQVVGSRRILFNLLIFY